MSDGLNKTGKLIGKMKPLNAMIFLVLVTLVLNTVSSQWSNYEDRKDRHDLLQQIVLLNKQNGELIKDQVKSDLIKKCVKEAQDEQVEEFNTVVIPQIGKTLQEHDVPFPQELNIILGKYRQKMGKIDTCLIFPQK